MKLHEIATQLTPKQIEWLDKTTDITGRWEVVDGKIDVEGSVEMTGYSRMTRIPVQFGYVSGDFIIYDNNLGDLKGSPREVGGIFDASGNNLMSLKGSPKEVGGDFVASGNNLTTLEGAPKEVGGDFYVTNNKFTSEPDHSFIKIGGNFYWERD